MDLYEAKDFLAENMTLGEILSLYRKLHQSNKDATLVFDRDEVLINGSTRSYSFKRKVRSFSH